MFTVTKIVMDIIDKKASGIKELIGLMLLCGLLAVWRSEGIILGLLSFGVYLIFVQRYKPIKVMLMSIAMTAVFLAFLIPQKIGDIKYYGKDYSFINTFFTLRNVLNSPDSDLSYEGVEEDLAAIEKIVPVSAVKLYGMDGYRRYNYANGRGDINQSLASNEDASAFMKAYWRIVFHNPFVYFRTQYSMIKIIIYIDSPLYVETCNEDIAIDLEPWELKAWETGYLDIYAYSDSLSSYSWALYYKLDTIIKWITGVFDKIHLYTIEIMFIVLSEAFILIKELITCFRKRKGNLAFAGLSLVLLIQFFALAAVVPAPTYQYLYGFLYSSFIVIFVYILSGFMKLRNQPHSSENE